MALSLIILIVCLIGVIGFVAGRWRALSLVAGNARNLHSRPNYYGWHVFIWATIPAFLFFVLWLSLAPMVIEDAVLDTFPDEVTEERDVNLTIAYGTVQAIAGGLRQLDARELAAVLAGEVELRPLLAEKGVAIAGNGERYMIASAMRLNAMADASRQWMQWLVIGLSLAGLALAFAMIKPHLRARNRVEAVVLGGLILASSIAILTTIGIIWSMIAETGQFFTSVPPREFFFGTVWDPRFAAPLRSRFRFGQFWAHPAIGRDTLYCVCRHGGRRAYRLVFGHLHG